MNCCSPNDNSAHPHGAFIPPLPPSVNSPGHELKATFGSGADWLSCLTFATEEAIPPFESESKKLRSIQKLLPNLVTRLPWTTKQLYSGHPDLPTGNVRMWTYNNRLPSIWKLGWYPFLDSQPSQIVRCHQSRGP